MLKRDWKKIYDELNHDSEKLIDLLIQHKDIDDLRWIDIANIANDLTGNHLSEDSYRKKANKRKSKLNYNIDDSDVIDEISKGRLCSNGMPKDEEREKFTELDYKILDLNVAKWQLSDERVQLNALYRRIAREENLRQMGKEIANTMSNFYQLPEVKHKDLEPSNEEQHEAILQISDWHYGIEINSPYNTYNPDIAYKRITQLRDRVCEIINKNNITKLYVINLGDLIAGRIHLQLRINSRIDVITQIIEVSELLAQLLNSISNEVEIEYYDTMDNHSRLEPNLKNNIELETLTRITTWMLKERLKDNDKIIIHDENSYGDDIITFTTKDGFNIAAVHGHKDNPSKVIDSLSMMTKTHYDLILSAHFHHFSADEKNETILISNSSLMGTDDYAQSLRLTAKPSQNLILLGKNNPIECIYNIRLDK
ncbi:MAG: hypothetical protein SPJ27_02515 [Candidatus Onthovivens sp.]|nr:hypothetical protein [Candidatus Onthovivens sp.]